MNIKKIIAIIASTALTVTLLASCGSSSSGKTAKKVTKDGKELSVLRVANMTGQPDQYADYIGMEQGIFEKYGISLETSEYAAGINTVDAIATGTADTGLLADFAAVNRIGNTLDNTNLVIFSDLSSSVSYNGGLFVAPKYKNERHNRGVQYGLWWRTCQYGGTPQGCCRPRFYGDCESGHPSFSQGILSHRPYYGPLPLPGENRPILHLKT